jgi:hypothetical protein
VLIAANLVLSFEPNPFTAAMMAREIPAAIPTRFRATAISVVVSGSRYLAMIGTITAGSLAAALGGFGKVARDLPYYDASIEPETVTRLNTFCRARNVLRGDPAFEAVVEQSLMPLWTD